MQVFKVSANEIANELGNLRVANMVALGAYVAERKTVQMESIFQALEKILGKKSDKIVELNKKALEQGAQAVTG